MAAAKLITGAIQKDTVLGGNNLTSKNDDSTNKFN
jgi:hypothetical protein